MNPSLLRLKIAQLAVDGLLILLSFALAYFLRVGFLFSTDFPFDQYMAIAVLTMPITLAFMFFSRAYRLSQQILSWRHLQRIAFVSIENVAVFMILYYFTYKNFFSRLILVYLFLLTTAFLYLWHLGFRKILQMMSQREIGVVRTLVIGTNRPAQEIVRELITIKSHLKPVAILDVFGFPEKEIHGVPVVGKLDKFETVVREYRIDQIIQVDHLEQSLNLINFSLQNNLRYMMPPELLGAFQGHQSVEEWEGMPFLKIYPRKRWWQNIW